MGAPSEFRADQCWRDKAGESWVSLQACIDVQLDPFGRAVLDEIGPRPGERALDIGCGSGQTVLELAELVGPSGHVLGVDISEPMLERARQRVEEKGLPHVTLELGDAEVHRFEGAFDLAFSRFGVMFFRDSVAAFRNLGGALRSLGRLGFVCWQDREKNEWAELTLQAVLAVLGTRDVPELYHPDRPGPFYLSDPLRIRSILDAAGYAEIDIQPFERPLHLGGATTLDEAVDYAMQVGPSSRAIADASPELGPAFRDALARTLAPFVSERGVWLGSAAFVVTAKRP